MNKLIIFVVALGLFISCGGPAADTETNQKMPWEEKWQHVLKVHDEIMLKMQENGEIEQRISLLLEQSETADSTSILAQQTDTLSILLHQLEEADEEMMDWMAQLKAPNSKTPNDSALMYLEQQEQDIIKVGEKMDIASEQALLFIKNLEN